MHPACIAVAIKLLVVDHFPLWPKSRSFVDHAFFIKIVKGVRRHGHIHIAHAVFHRIGDDAAGPKFPHFHQHARAKKSPKLIAQTQNSLHFGFVVWGRIDLQVEEKLAVGEAARGRAIAGNGHSVQLAVLQKRSADPGLPEVSTTEPVEAHF